MSICYILSEILLLIYITLIVYDIPLSHLKKILSIIIIFKIIWLGLSYKYTVDDNQQTFRDVSPLEK